MDTESSGVSRRNKRKPNITFKCSDLASHATNIDSAATVPLKPRDNLDINCNTPLVASAYNDEISTSTPVVDDSSNISLDDSYLDDDESRPSFGSPTSAELEAAERAGLIIDEHDPTDEQDFGLSSREGVHGTGELYCSVCNFQAPNAARLRTHMQIHNSKHTFRCGMCLRGYKRSSDLNRHMKMLHGIRLRDYLQKQGITRSRPLYSHNTSATAQITSPLPANAPLPSATQHPHVSSLQESYVPQVIVPNTPGNQSFFPFSANTSFFPSTPPVSAINMPSLNSASKAMDFSRPTAVAGNDNSLPIDLQKNSKLNVDCGTNDPLDLSSAVSKTHEPQDCTLSFIDSSVQNVGEKAGEFKCSLCDFAGQSLPQLKSHERNKHALEQKFQCPYCSRCYTLSADLNIHLKRTHKVMSYVKEDMQVSQSKEEVGGPAPVELKPNMAQEFLSKPRAGTKKDEAYFCPHCSYIPQSQVDLHQHLRGHSQVKPFKCLFCSYGSRWRCDCKNHMKKHHRDKWLNDPTLLNECMRRVNRNARALLYQIRNMCVTSVSSSSTETCPLPSLDSSTTAPQVSCSDTANHPIFPDLETPANLPVESDGCLPTRQAINVPSSELSLIEIPPISSDGFYHCPKCKYRARAVDKIEDHLSSHNDYKIYKCPVCGKRANWSWDIRKHIDQRHPGIQNCEIVKMPLNEARNSLNAYLFSRQDLDFISGEDSIMESLVGESAESSESRDSIDKMSQDADNDNGETLTAQEDKDLSEDSRPFKCSVCGRRSNWRWDIRKHARYVHPGVEVTVVDVKTGHNAYELDPHERSDYLLARNRNRNYLAKARSQLGIKIHKCPNCPYRSNWYSDVFRHIRIQHKTKGQVVIMDEYEARESIPAYEKWYQQRKDTIRKCGGTDMSAELLVESETSNSPKTPTTSSGNMPFPSPGSSFFPSAPAPNAVVLPDTQIPVMNSPANAGLASLMSFFGSNPQFGQISQLQQMALSLSQIQHDTLQAKRLSENPADDATGSKDFMTEILQRMAKNLANAQGMIQPKASELPTPASQFSSSADSSKSDITARRRCWKCGMCNFKSRNHHVVSLHCLTHRNMRYKCALCHYSSGHKSSVYRHGMSIHAEQFASGMAATYIMENPNWDPKGSNKLPHCQPVLVDTDPFSFSPSSSPEQDFASARPVSKANLIKFRCKLCAFVTRHRSAVYRHLRMTHKLTYTGSFYHTIMQDINQLNEKTKSDSGHEPAAKRCRTKFECPKCPFVCRREENYQKHVVMHKPRPGAGFKCSSCDYSAKTQDVISKHIALHTRSNKAGETNNCVSDEASLTNPDKSDEPLDLSIMPESEPKPIQIHSVRPLNPNTLLGSFPLNEKPAASISTPKQVYPVTSTRHLSNMDMLRCHFCPYVADRKSQLYDHERCHIPRPGTVKCPQCDYYTKSHGVLGYHLRNVHNLDIALQHAHAEGSKSDWNSKPRPRPPAHKKYTCPRCPYATQIPKHLERHIMLHGSRQEFVCRFCDYSVSKAHLIVQHEALHEAKPGLASTSVPASSIASSLTSENCINSRPNGNSKPSSSTCNVTEGVVLSCDAARCPFKTVSRKALINHNKYHLSRRCNACPQCSFSAEDNDFLSEHIALHLTSIPGGLPLPLIPTIPQPPTSVFVPSTIVPSFVPTPTPAQIKPESSSMPPVFMQPFMLPQPTAVNATAPTSSNAAQVKTEIAFPEPAVMANTIPK